MGQPAGPFGFLTPRVWVAGIAWLAACILVGAATVPYGGWAQESVGRMLALPAVIALAFLFILDKEKLLLLILLVRALVDPLIDATRFAPFLSLGAVFNVLVIVIVMTMMLEKPRVLTRIGLPVWGPLLAIALVQTLRSPEFVTALRTFLGLVSYAAIFLAPFYMADGRRDLRYFFTIILLSSVAPALYGVVDFLQGATSDGRVRSTFPHANIFAFYLVLMVSLAFYLVKSVAARTSVASRALLILYIAFLLLLLITTKTRSAWAACLMVFAVYGLLVERRYLIYLAVGCALAILIPDVRDRLLDVYDVSMFSLQQNSYQWRQELWQSAWQWMQWKSMGLGYGLASFPLYSLDFFAAQGNGIRWGAHSVYVQWFFEAGALGVACAAWFFLRVFVMLRRFAAVDRIGGIVIFTLVFAYLTVSYSDNMLDYLAFNWYFWFAIGAACAIASRDGGKVSTTQANQTIPGRKAVRPSFAVQGTISTGPPRGAPVGTGGTHP